MIGVILSLAIFAVLSAAVSVWFLVKLKTELRALMLGAVSSKVFGEAVENLSTRIESLESRIAQIGDHRREHADWLSKSESLNLNGRGQVLRLHRRGELAPAIASTLHMTQGEVELMIKVYEVGRSLAAVSS